MNSAIRVRPTTTEDQNAIWEIFSAVVKKGDTYVYDPAISKSAGLVYWMGKGIHTYVAEVEGRILGTYILKQNQPGFGSHVANGSYMVAPTAHGPRARDWISVGETLDRRGAADGI